MPYLRQSHNVKPVRYGSDADVIYSIAKNSEKIFGVDPDTNCLIMPLFFGFPCLDFSGKQNHRTPVGGVAYHNGSLSFDGVNDYVDCGNNASVKPSFPITLSVCFKSNDTGNFKALFFNDEWVESYYGFGVQKSSADVIACAYGDGGLADSTHRRTKLGTTSLIVNKIYHVSVVINGATDMQIYINGVDDGGTYSGTGGALAYSSATAKIGSNLASFWNGLISEVRINNSALTAEQNALFYARKWDLYRRVGRTYYSIAAVPSIYIPQIMIF